MYKTIQQTLLLVTATLAGTALAAPTTPLSRPGPSAVRARDGATSSSYMDVVSLWRANLGLSALAEDAGLAANAQKTVDDGRGQMAHELNPGTLGQVLAPGQPDEFEHVFVGGWLCEMPDMDGLGDVCASDLGQGWYYDGQTGHAEILTSPSYSRIGCANAMGIWACDLA
ncbi:hypothetical protein SLS62_007939 [Diatrype stigma]|uniref:SCP domain-containing protein n=1 Tax=Diatrype stigma TaxID=117547 RepID=A0AAN9UN65_9PEZI